MTTISISDAFDGGNIKHIATTASVQEPDLLEVSVHVKPDVYTELEQIHHMQYFSFRVTINFDTNQSKQKVKYLITNASKTSYPLAWKDSTVFYSNNYNNVDNWRRVKDTFYTEGNLWWEYEHSAKEATVYFSYFPPFSYERHLTLISKCQDYANKVETLGQSLEGREMECIVHGSGDLVCWIIHRQHPGETMAEHYAEGTATRQLHGRSIQDDCEM
jgi:murein tripeptide amidase MpaA